MLSIIYRNIKHQQMTNKRKLLEIVMCLPSVEIKRKSTKIVKNILYINPIIYYRIMIILIGNFYRLFIRFIKSCSM